MNNDALLALASDLVAKAASAIMAIKAAGFAVERKSDHSPVTEADRIAEALIVEGLRAATPDIPVIAEEEAGWWIPWMVRGNSPPGAIISR